MHKLRCLHLSAAVLAFAALVGMEARSAELEGALQYPPRSVGQDAQPPPPAKTNMNGELACNRAGGNYGSSRDRDYRRQWRGNGYGDGNRDYGPGWGTSSGYSRYRGDWPPAYPSDYGR
jgi:hypothetical protein